MIVSLMLITMGALMFDLDSIAVSLCPVLEKGDGNANNLVSSSSEIVVPWEPRLLKRRMLRKSYLLEATQKRFLIT